MIYKKLLDDLDPQFVDEPWREEEHKKFSAILKEKKLQVHQKNRLVSTSRTKKQHHVKTEVIS